MPKKNAGADRYAVNTTSQSAAAGRDHVTLTRGGVPSVLKIAYLLTPIDFGGSERVSLNFLQNVDRDRFDILPILLVRPWEAKNVFIRELEKENYPYRTIPVAVRPPSEGKEYFRVLRCHRVAHTMLKDGSFDLVHTHGYFADIIGIPAARRLGLPVISTCHGFISTDRNLKVYNLLDRIALRFSDRIIAVSGDIKKNLVNNGIDERRIDVIQNAVRPDADPLAAEKNAREKLSGYGISRDDLVLGCVGRLSEEKGVRHLIEALEGINASGVPVKALIIGDGPQRKELEDLAKARGVDDMVVFAGFQSEIDDWLPAIDIFALPSLTEGTPMSLLEAMAHGIPAVASGVGGVPQVIESGKNGILVTPERPDEIKDAVLLLYRDPSLRESLSEAARKTISLKYDIREWSGKIEAQYLKTLEGRRTKTR